MRTRLLYQDKTGRRWFKEIESFLYKGYTYRFDDQADAYAYHSKYAVQYYERMPSGASIISFKMNKQGGYWNEVEKY